MQGLYTNVPSSGASSCVACGVSTYQPFVNASSPALCQACPPHTVTLADGSPSLSSCVCNMGYYGLAGGNCTACAPGSYTPGGGVNNTACTPCGPNTYDSGGVGSLLRAGIDICIGELVSPYWSPEGATCAEIYCIAGYYIPSPFAVGDSRPVYCLFVIRP